MGLTLCGFRFAALFAGLAEASLLASGQAPQVVDWTHYPLSVLDLRFVDEMGVHAEAEAGVRALLKNLGQPGDQITIVMYLYTLAHHCDAQGKLPEAEASYREALKVRETDPAARREVDEALLLTGLAGNLARQNKLAEAERMARRAVSIWERGDGREKDIAVRGRGVLARILSLQGRNVEAESLYRRVQAVQGLAESDPNFAAAVCEGYAALLRRTGRFAAAAEQEARSLVIRTRAAKEHLKELESETSRIEQRAVDGPRYLREHPGMYPRGVAEELAKADVDAATIHYRRLVRAHEAYAAALRKSGHGDESAVQESKAKALRESVSKKGRS